MLVVSYNVMRCSVPPLALCLANIPQTQGKEDTDSRHLFIIQRNKCKASLWKHREPKSKLGKRRKGGVGRAWVKWREIKWKDVHILIYTHRLKKLWVTERKRWSSGANVVSHRISSRSMTSRVLGIFQPMKGDERSASRLRFKPPCVSTINSTQSKPRNPSDHIRNRCTPATQPSQWYQVHTVARSQAVVSVAA